MTKRQRVYSAEQRERKRSADRARYERMRDEVLEKGREQRLERLARLSPLTKDAALQVVSYCRETGQFVRLSTGDIAGTKKPDGRRYISIGPKVYAEHRLAWLIVHGDWPSQQIDHIDGDPANNRIENLRDVSDLVNKQNLRKAPAGKKYSPLFGAQWCKQAGKWKASIKIDGRQKFLGFFASDAEASDAYLEAKRLHHEGCTI